MVSQVSRFSGIVGRLLVVVWPFLGIVLLLMLLDAHSGRMLAGARALIAANGSVAVAQQGAVSALRRFAWGGDSRTYRDYRAHAAVLHADRRARETVLSDAPDWAVARTAWAEAGNAPEDVAALGSFLRAYAHFPPVRAALDQRHAGDALLDQLDNVAARLDVVVDGEGAASSRVQAMLMEIEHVDAGLQPVERHFAQSMNEAARALQQRFQKLRLAATVLLGLLGLLLSLRAVRRQLVVEQALRVSEERHALVAEGANDGVWEWEVASDRLYCSPRMRELLGYEEAQLGRSRDMAAFMPREDYVRSRRELAEFMRARRDGTLSRTMRMRTRDGRMLWVLARSVVLYAEGGAPLRVAGSLTDITEQVENERQLRLAASVFEAAREGIVITDADGHVLSANRAFHAFSGYKPGTLAGRRVHALWPMHADWSLRREMARALKDVGEWHGEIAAHATSDEARPMELSITTVHDDDDRIAFRIYICRDIAESRYTEARIRHLAYFDTLTGLPNRGYLGTHFEGLLGVARGGNAALAVVFFDLDGFKEINDTLGHSAGDQLLRLVAQRLGEGIGESDLLCRFGGDEFLLVLPGRNPVETEAIAADLLHRVGRPMQVEGRMLAITASAGYAMFPQDAEDAESLVRDADMALYRAKDRGKNIVARYQPWMSTEVSWRHDMLASIRRALEEKQFQLRFQPVVDIDSGRVAGVETLLYWDHPDMGMVSPSSFIPLAEDSGLIEPIGVWLFDAALSQYALWRAAGLPRFYIALNLAGYQLRRAAVFEEQFLAAAERHGVPCADIVLEITERQIVYDIHASLPVLDRLSGRGIGLSIDDFGTGYSSLEYLKDMPVTQIKIDKTFVHNLATEVGDRAIVNAILGLGRSLAVGVVAEGVENDDQLRVLRGYGCNLVQGYLYAPPLQAADVPDFVRARAAEALRD